jgi:hypothetical protein
MYVPVITTTWKAAVGGSQFEACLKKKKRRTKRKGNKK